MSNPVALITGASRRIGAEIAKKFHAKAWNVIIHYHANQVAAEALVAALNAKRARSACALAADLTDLSGLAYFMSESLAAFGRLDCLVNNASLFFPTPIEEVDLVSLRRHQAIHVEAPVILSQLAFPYLKQQAGSIVNITDIQTDKPLKNYALYCIAKGGLLAANAVLAKEFAPDVRVNAVAPGANIEPEGVNALSDEAKRALLASIPLKTIGTPSDIADAVCYLAEANYVTGQVLAVDGGRLLS